MVTDILGRRDDYRDRRGCRCDDSILFFFLLLALIFFDDF